jgi:hypothetical protein
MALHDRPVAQAAPSRHSSAMPRIRKKADLPSKICARCGRPFSWRKKWSRDWAEVRYCSDACRAGKGPKPEGRD